MAFNQDSSSLVSGSVTRFLNMLSKLWFIMYRLPSRSFDFKAMYMLAEGLPGVEALVADAEDEAAFADAVVLEEDDAAFVADAWADVA